MVQVAGSTTQSSPTATPKSLWNVRGTFDVQNTTSGTSTLSNVSGSATNVTVLAANDERVGAYVFNDSTADLYLKFGTTASTTSFTVKVLPGGFFELAGPHVYNGIIDGIWSSAAGTARVTEIT